MRLVLLILVGANLIFFAVHQGYLGALLPEEREPLRLAQQIKPELMRLQGETLNSAKQAAELPTKTAPASEAKRAEADPPTACMEYGSFTQDESKTAAATLASQFPNAKIEPRNASEITGYTVYLPPYKTRDEAVAAVEELKQIGIKDYFIIDDSSPLRLGISLASLRTEDQAKAQLATLTKKGVKNAQINPRTSNRIWLQLHDTDSAKITAKLAELKSKYPNQEVKVCTRSN